MKKILIFNVNWLGDVLFSTATIRNIRYNYPDSYIACIIPSRCLPILEGNPHLDEIIIFDEKGQHFGILAKIIFILNLRAKKFDMAFLLHRSLTRALICRLAGIPRRIGYYTKKRSFLLTSNIISPGPDKMHRIDYYLNIIAKADLKVKDRFTEFFINEGDQKVADKFLRDNAIKADDIVVGLNPGGNWDCKRWPKENFALLGERLIKDLSAQIVITGSFQDIRLAKKIQGMIKGRTVLACGALNLKQLGGLCRRLSLFVTADSGPLHIANSVGTKKIIALFGPTHPSVTGPYPMQNVVVLSRDVGCSIPCYDKDCHQNRCMSSITPEEVASLACKIVT
jgi:lipopolysaccharide heptosyltransferase II